MAFINEDQGIILLSQLADFPQGCNITVHGEGTISGHQPQSMFLFGRERHRWDEDVTLRGWQWDTLKLLYREDVPN